ncbi:hypothetical protein GCM10020331_055640 [Ectobacillus funiculus]
MKNRKITAYFHTLAETVNDAVTAVDQEGKVICWNATTEGTYGIKREKYSRPKDWRIFSRGGYRVTSYFK